MGVAEIIRPKWQENDSTIVPISGKLRPVWYTKKLKAL